MSRRLDCPCIGCGKLLVTTPRSAVAEKRMCQPCRAARRLAGRTCAQCGKIFHPASGKPGDKAMTCSFSCAQLRRCAEGRGRRTYVTPEEQDAARLDRWQRKNRRRRAQKRGVPSERYTLAEIAVRDGHRCGLCGLKVKMDLKHLDPLAPTIDHVIPISLGGDDTRANVQLAHFRCNNLKGARGGGEQLALVG